MPSPGGSPSCVYESSADVLEQRGFVNIVPVRCESHLGRSATGPQFSIDYELTSSRVVNMECDYFGITAYFEDIDTTSNFRLTVPYAIIPPITSHNIFGFTIYGHDGKASVSNQTSGRQTTNMVPSPHADRVNIRVTFLTVSVQSYQIVGTALEFYKGLQWADHCVEDNDYYAVDPAACALMTPGFVYWDSCEGRGRRINTSIVVKQQCYLHAAHSTGSLIGEYL